MKHFTESTLFDISIVHEDKTISGKTCEGVTQLVKEIVTIVHNPQTISRVLIAPVEHNYCYVLQTLEPQQLLIFSEFNQFDYTHTEITNTRLSISAISLDSLNKYRLEKEVAGLNLVYSQEGYDNLKVKEVIAYNLATGERLFATV